MQYLKYYVYICEINITLTKRFVFSHNAFHHYQISKMNYINKRNRIKPAKLAKKYPS